MHHVGEFGLGLSILKWFVHAVTTLTLGQRRGCPSRNFFEMSVGYYDIVCHAERLVHTKQARGMTITKYIIFVQ